MSSRDTYISLPELENYRGSIDGIIKVLQRYQRRYPGNDVLISSENRKALVRLVVKGKENSTQVTVEDIRSNDEITKNNSKSFE